MINSPCKRFAPIPATSKMQVDSLNTSVGDDGGEMWSACQCERALWAASKGADEHDIPNATDAGAPVATPSKRVKRAK